MAVENLITEHIDIWTSAVKTKSASGRGSNKKLELYGVKKLRELILELAVRGKLVPQDPNDEPASVLLERIKDERRAEAKNGKLKEVKAISENEFPYKLPINWSFVRLEEIIQISSGKNLTAKKMDTSGKIPVYGGNGVTGIHSESNVSEKTIVIGRVGFYCGSVHLTPACAWVTDNAFITKYSRANLDEDFLVWLLKETNLRENDSATAQPVISGKKVYPIVVALPPKEEQRLIAAKIDELLALCDQLEQQTEASIEAHQVLVTTLLDTLTNSADADELMQNWARISEHFDTLFTTEESIDQLKQTILQLAVMGALSQPLNSDTPIDVHLDNILEQQKQLATAKEYSLIEAEVLKAKNEISNNRVVLKARCFCNFITKGTTPSKNELLETGDVPFLKVYNIVNNELDFDYRPIFISNEVHTSKLKRSIAHPGDVIMNIVGPPLGKVAVLSEQYPQWNMNQALAVFKPVSSVFNRYLYYVLSCELTLRSVLSEVKGTAGQDNLSLEQCRDLLVPIMSIQEQQRLVCLVDSLWDYCDRLKKRMKSSQKTQLHLTDAVTGQAV
ncbi:TPA: restriction endonuclease subunit S [Vibrio diabolicus]